MILFKRLSFWGYLRIVSNCTIFNCYCLLTNRKRSEFLFSSKVSIIFPLRHLFLFEFSFLPLFSTFIIELLSFHFWHLEGLSALFNFFISMKQQIQKQMIRIIVCYLMVFLLFHLFYQFIYYCYLYWIQSFNLY
jgi:hypothetical protein